MKNNLQKAYLTTFITLMSFIVKADPVDPPADPDPLPSPIDNQIIWLVIAGIALGYYIINKRKASLSK